MPVRHKLTPADHEALRQIREILQRYPGSFGRIEDPLTQQMAQELLHYPPREAVRKAEEFREQIKRLNDLEEEKTAQAAKRMAELRERPVYSLGRTGIIGAFFRSFMASLNATPLTSTNWYELTDRGLVVHMPFSSVTERTVNHIDLLEKRLELGVNPPFYFDWILGMLKQLRINIQTPWGTITLREPGSGVTLAEIVELKPNLKLAQIRQDLAAIHRVRYPYVNHRLLPRLVDLYSYYLDEWDPEFRVQLPEPEEPAAANENM